MPGGTLTSESNNRKAGRDKKEKSQMKFMTQLLEILWNGSPDAISGSGAYSDRFIGPNKILRVGTFDIGGDYEGEALEFRAVITLGKIIAKQAHPANGRKANRKSRAA
jgi:hypothetical protein